QGDPVGAESSDGAVRADGSDRSRHDAGDPRGPAPRPRRSQVPSLPAAAPVRRGRLAGAQERPRGSSLRRRRENAGGRPMTAAPGGEPLVRDARDGAVVTLTVNRPAARNALDTATVDALTAAFEAIDRDTSVRCAILTGAGDRAFVAGADIKA